jgi:hypothetical protein
MLTRLSAASPPAERIYIDTNRLDATGVMFYNNQQPERSFDRKRTYKRILGVLQDAPIIDGHDWLQT